ncbi:hypothetical protein [Caldicellulosiruptor naganoensis]|uniref:Uncharacterized protein n=1 Tax=Caldicellulosiruptor naganoensis TaxID=29324 RepID=A0ABY7BI91_9FIRM|nr:hypothetical protein [Caldicellulosiruptor naganoensis]WAM30751.1 hypothetical protein OTJ99_001528 [Caldicellulosiruptor naganoensis]
MKYWRRLLSFILTIILSSAFFTTCLSMNFFKFETKVFSNSDFYEYIKKALENKKSGFVTIVVLKDPKNSLSVRYYLEKNGINLEKGKVAVNTDNKGLFFLYSGDGRLAFVFESNLKNGFWTEKSADTKRKGLVLEREFLGLIKDYKKSSSVPVSKSFVIKLWRLFWILNYQLQYLNSFLIFLFAIIIVFSVLGAIIFLSKPNEKYNKFFLKFIPMTVVLGYIFVIYSPLLILKINNIFLFLAIFFLTALVTSSLGLKISQLLCSLFGIFSILGQAFLFDNILQLLSTAGYHPSFANRFYGIGNEFFAYLMGFVFILSIVSNMSFRNLFVTLFLSAFVLIIPYYGVNFGGFLSIVAGITVFLLFKTREKIKVLAALFAFVPLALILILKNSYVYKAFASFDTLFSIAKRKMLMNLSYLFQYPATILLLLAFVVLFLLIVQKRFNILSLTEKHREIFTLFFIIGLFAYFFNDSGIIIVALLQGFLGVGIYYSKMVNEYGVR